MRKYQNLSLFFAAFWGISSTGVCYAATNDTQGQIAQLTQMVKENKQRSERLEQRISELTAKMAQSNNGSVSPKPKKSSVLISAQKKANDENATGTGAIKLNRNAGYNQSLKILQEEQRSANKMKQMGETITYPRIELGGSASIDLSSSKSFQGPTSQDFNLSGANINLAADINSWVNTYLSLNYEGGPLPGTLTQSTNGIDTQVVRPTSVVRLANSRIFLSKGFITFGDLNRMPFYLSLGQMSAPFGEYATNILTPPFTARLGRINQRMMLLGYQQPGTNEGFNGSIFAFRGDSKLNSANQRGFISNGGLNLGYDFSRDKLKVTTGTSLIANIADSGGMQNTNAPFLGDDQWWFEPVEDDEVFEELIPATTFAGFGRTSATEVLQHRVPGADIRAKVEYDRYFIQSEYTTATRSFAAQNLTFNDRGAKPSAVDAQVGMKFKILDKNAMFALNYGHSWQSLGLNMPQTRYAAAFRLLPWKNITTALEFRIDRNYAVGTSTTGQGDRVAGAATSAQLGKSARSVVAQLGVSF